MRTFTVLSVEVPVGFSDDPDAPPKIGRQAAFNAVAQMIVSLTGETKEIPVEIEVDVRGAKVYADAQGRMVALVQAKVYAKPEIVLRLRSGYERSMS